MTLTYPNIHFDVFYLLMSFHILKFQKYIRDCITKHLSAKLKASSSHSNISKNYSTPGVSGLYMRPHGTTNIYQTSPLSNGASPAGCDILGKESYGASHAGLLYNNGNFHGNANGNCSG
jgi:hypothetical protein